MCVCVRAYVCACVRAYVRMEKEEGDRGYSCAEYACLQEGWLPVMGRFKVGAFDGRANVFGYNYTIRKTTIVRVYRSYQKHMYDSNRLFRLLVPSITILYLNAMGLESDPVSSMLLLFFCTLLQ